MNRTQAFGKTVKARRLELGLKQTDLAERTGLHVNFISFVERGVHAPAIDTVFAIADALDTTGSDLLALAEAAATRPRKP